MKSLLQSILFSTAISGLIYFALYIFANGAISSLDNIDNEPTLPSLPFTENLSSTDNQEKKQISNQNAFDLERNQKQLEVTDKCYKILTNEGIKEYKKCKAENSYTNQKKIEKKTNIIDEEIPFLIPPKPSNLTPWQIYLIYVFLFLLLFCKVLLYFTTRYKTNIKKIDNFVNQKRDSISDWTINSPTVLGLIGTLLSIGLAVKNIENQDILENFELAFIQNFTNALDTTIIGGMLYIINYMIFVLMQTNSKVKK